MMKKNLLMLLCAVSLLTNVAWAADDQAPAADDVADAAGKAAKDAVKNAGGNEDEQKAAKKGAEKAVYKKMAFANRGISNDVNSFWDSVKARGSNYTTGANWKPNKLFGWDGRATGVGANLASDITRSGIWGAYVDAVVRGDKSLMHRLGAKIAAMTHLNKTGFGKWFGDSRVAQQGSYLTAAVLADFLAALPTRNSSIAGGIYRGGRSLGNWGGRATGLMKPGYVTNANAYKFDKAALKEAQAEVDASLNLRRMLRSNVAAGKMGASKPGAWLDKLGLGKLGDVFAAAGKDKADVEGRGRAYPADSGTGADYDNTADLIGDMFKGEGGWPVEPDVEL